MSQIKVEGSKVKVKTQKLPFSALALALPIGLSWGIKCRPLYICLSVCMYLHPNVQYSSTIIAGHNQMTHGTILHKHGAKRIRFVYSITARKPFQTHQCIAVSFHCWISIYVRQKEELTNPNLTSRRHCEMFWLQHSKSSSAPQ